MGAGELHWPEDNSAQMDPLLSLPSLSPRLKKRELAVLSQGRGMIFVIKLRTFLYYTGEGPAATKEAGKASACTQSAQ